MKKVKPSLNDLINKNKKNLRHVRDEGILAVPPYLNIHHQYVHSS